MMHRCENGKGADAGASAGVTTGVKLRLEWRRGFKHGQRSLPDIVGRRLHLGRSLGATHLVVTVSRGTEGARLCGIDAENLPISEGGQAV